MKIYCFFSMMFLACLCFACGKSDNNFPSVDVKNNLPKLGIQTQDICPHRMCYDSNITFGSNYYFEDFNPGGSCGAGWNFSWNSGGGSITCGQSVDGVNALYFNGDWSRDYHLGWVQNKIPSTGNVGLEIRYRFRNVSGFGPNPIMVGTQSTYNGGRHTCCSPWSPNPNAAYIENVLHGGQSDSGWGVGFNNNASTSTDYNKSPPQLGWFVVRWLYKADEQMIRMTVRTNSSTGIVEYDNYGTAQVGRPNIIVTGNPVRLDWYGQWPDYYIDYIKTYNFTVNYDITAPILTVGADLLLNATGPSGISYSVTKPTAVDNEDPNPVIMGKVNSQTGQDLTYPYLFSGGVTTIWWKATDISGNFSWKSQKVTVNLDSTPPIISNTSDMNIDQQDATGANWNGPFPIITDDQDPAPVLTAHLNSQTAATMTFPAHFFNGTSTIWWKGQDKNGNIAWGAQKIIVIQDTQAPIITVSGNLKTEQQTLNGTQVILSTPVVSDKNSYTLESRLNSITGTIITFPYTFQLGITSVYWTASDKFGNVGSAIQLVEIVDTQKPSFFPPSDIIEEANEPNGNIIDIGTVSSVADICDTNVIITN